MHTIDTQTWIMLIGVVVLILAALAVWSHLQEKEAISQTQGTLRPGIRPIREESRKPVKG